MTEKLFAEVTQWQKETFPNATTLSKILHLRKEVNELEVDVKLNLSGKHLEFADCFFLLFGAAAAEGMTYQDICNAIVEKMEINKKRLWGNPDKDGVVYHVKE